MSILDSNHTTVADGSSVLSDGLIDRRLLPLGGLTGNVQEEAAQKCGCRKDISTEMNGWVKGGDIERRHSCR